MPTADPRPGELRAGDPRVAVPGAAGSCAAGPGPGADVPCAAVPIVPAVGSALLDALRGGGRPRPAVDRAWCGGLREHLEDLVGPLTPPAGEPVRAGWRWLETGDPPAGRRPGRAPLARTRPAMTLTDALVAPLFRQHATGVPVTAPLEQALQALRAAGDPDGVAAAVDRLPLAERQHVGDRLAVLADRLAASWPVVDPRWMPTAGELLLASLAGGRVVVGARPDLCLGPPARDRAARCLLVVGAGRPGPATWRRLWTAALVETLRVGAPPFRVAALSVDPWGLAVQDVAAAGLWATAEALVAALERRLRRPPAIAGRRGLAASPPWAAAPVPPPPLVLPSRPAPQAGVAVAS